ncbi:MAG TPA: serine--tRNA ligase [Gammaproteobacteria bacterium]|nr:serine--tRNA ligase [Gammaproteobacteria bacterium]
MIDPKLIRHDAKIVLDNLSKRKNDFKLDDYLSAEEAARKIQTEVENLRSTKNKLTKTIGSSKLDEKAKEKIVDEVHEINESLKDAEAKLEGLSVEVKNLSLLLPNILHESVPDGNDEKDNVKIRQWGEIREFSFEPKDHTQLGEDSGWIDFQSASKISGSRFAVIIDRYAQLHRSLIHFMLDIQTNVNGYTEYYVPSIIRSECLEGTGQLPKFAEDQYKIENEENLYLIPTAEVPLTNLVRESIIETNQLPIKMVAHTPCYRQEAGSYGQDTRGMIRQHQFEKVELVHIVKPEESYQALEELTENAESILVKLGLPYRVMLLCSSDTGFAAAKTYDIEVWLPSQNKYREISSCSNCESFQARRMKARFKDLKTNQNEYVHTLNGSGLAVGRTFIAVLENYQNEDGTITIPEVLRPYMGGIEII